MTSSELILCSSGSALPPLISHAGEKPPGRFLEFFTLNMRNWAAVLHHRPATGVTDYLKHEGTLENALQMANHSSPRTTKRYDCRAEEASLDEYAKVGI
jgi:hypothetical protein